MLQLVDRHSSALLHRLVVLLNEAVKRSESLVFRLGWQRHKSGVRVRRVRVDEQVEESRRRFGGHNAGDYAHEPSQSIRNIGPVCYPVNVTLEQFKKRTKRLPDTPGVYFFLDKRKKVLYIGKATSLRDRTRSYF